MVTTSFVCALSLRSRALGDGLNDVILMILEDYSRYLIFIFCKTFFLGVEATDEFELVL